MEILDTLEILFMLASLGGAFLISRNSGHGFEGHVLFTVANVAGLIFFSLNGHWYVVMTQCGFLFTSVNGLRNHHADWSRRKRAVISAPAAEDCPLNTEQSYVTRKTTA